MMTRTGDVDRLLLCFRFAGRTGVQVNSAGRIFEAGDTCNNTNKTTQERPESSTESS